MTQQSPSFRSWFQVSPLFSSVSRRSLRFQYLCLTSVWSYRSQFVSYQLSWITQSWFRYDRGMIIDWLETQALKKRRERDLGTETGCWGRGSRQLYEEEAGLLFLQEFLLQQKQVWFPLLPEKEYGSQSGCGSSSSPLSFSSFSIRFQFLAPCFLWRLFQSMIRLPLLLRPWDDIFRFLLTARTSTSCSNLYFLLTDFVVCYLLSFLLFFTDNYGEECFDWSDRKCCCLKTSFISSIPQDSFSRRQH